MNKIEWVTDFGAYRKVLKTIIDIVPQFFGLINKNNIGARFDEKIFILRTKENEVFNIFYAPSAEIKDLVRYIQQNFQAWIDEIKVNTLIDKKVELSILSFWIQNITKDKNVLWESIIKEIDELSHYSNEKKIRKLNFVLLKTEKEEELYTIKLLDFINDFSKLSHSDSTYFTMNIKNTNLYINSLEELPQMNAATSVQYYCLPENLVPYGKLNEKANTYFSIHILGNGELIILNKSGIIASKRDDKWRIFTLESLKKFFYDRFELLYNKGTIGRQMLDIAMKMSYRKKGGLLVFENNKNKDSIPDKEPDEGSILNKVKSRDFNLKRQKKLNNLTDNIFSLSDNSIYKIKKKEIFMNLAEQDGAIICNKQGIISSNSFLVGDINADDNEPIKGAREYAAEVAFNKKEKNKTIVIQISEDGKIKIFFHYADMPMYMSLK